MEEALQASSAWQLRVDRVAGELVARGLAPYAAARQAMEICRRARVRRAIAIALLERRAVRARRRALA